MENNNANAVVRRSFLKRFVCRAWKYVFIVFTLCMFTAVLDDGGITDVITSPQYLVKVPVDGAVFVWDGVYDVFTESPEERRERIEREWLELFEPQFKHEENYVERDDSGDTNDRWQYSNRLFEFTHAINDSVYLHLRVKGITEVYVKDSRPENSSQFKDYLKIDYVLVYKNDTGDLYLPDRLHMNFRTSRDKDNAVLHRLHNLPLNESNGNKAYLHGTDTHGDIFTVNNDTVHSSPWLTNGTTEGGFTRIEGTIYHDFYLQTRFYLESLIFEDKDSEVKPYEWKHPKHYIDRP